MDYTDKRYKLVKKLTVIILFFIVLFFGLIQAKSFLAPIFLAGFLSYLLYPLGRFLEKVGIPRIPANLICIISGLLAVGAFFYFFIRQFSVFSDGFPAIQEQAQKNLASLEQWISSVLDVPQQNVRDWINESLGALADNGDMLKTAFQFTTDTVLLVGLMPVYIFFMLYYRSKFQEFLLRMAPDHRQSKTKDILDEVNKVTYKYISGVFLVVVILCVLHSIGLSIVGIKYPILLGVTAALFNFIPYFGTLIGGLIPLTFSLLAMDNPNYALWVTIYFLIIQFVENNILTPNITGGSVQLNPFVTILSLIFGSMIWGVAGMFMIVPILAMFRIVCEHFSSLKPIAFLLSNRGMEEHSISLKKIKDRFKSRKKN